MIHQLVYWNIVNQFHFNIAQRIKLKIKPRAFNLSSLSFRLGMLFIRNTMFNIIFFFFILFTQFQLINCFSVECSLFSCVFLCCCPALSGLSNCYFPSIVCHKSSFVIVLVLPLLLMCNVYILVYTRSARIRNDEIE